MERVRMSASAFLFFKDFLYLDPGSGSFILQLLIAGLLGGAFMIKVYWRKIKSIFTGKPVEPQTPEEQDPKNES
jgi:hypothetical protein